MIIPIELRFKADKDSKSAFRTEKTIKSHDVNSVEFHITIDGLELTDSHTAKILSVFHTSESQANVNCEIVEGKIIYKPDTKLISRHEHVTNYVYVYKDNQSLDVREFIYVVDLSKIDETSLEVKEVYDQSYADLLADFEQALNDYKDNLPHPDSVRAEIDEVLNKFSEDSQAKLSQYNSDAQQVITDNQAAFDLAESGRQDSYVQAEDIRNQASNQAVVDWEQGADELVDSKLIEMQTDASNLINGAIDDFNVRGDAEIADWREGADADLVRLDSEKANRKQEDWITPTLLNGTTTDPDNPVGYMKDEMGFVHFKGRIKATGVSIGLSLASGYNFSLQQGKIKRFLALTSVTRTIADVQINYAGHIYVSAASSDVWVHLDGICYKAGD